MCRYFTLCDPTGEEIRKYVGGEARNKNKHIIHAVEDTILP